MASRCKTRKSRDAPVMGASTSSRLGSSRRILVASRMMNRACQGVDERAPDRNGAGRADLVVGQPPLAVEVVLEEGNVGLCAGRVGVELVVGGLAEGGALDVLHDALLCRVDLALVIRVHAEVDGREAGAAVVHGRDGGGRVEPALVRVHGGPQTTRGARR